MFKFCLTFFSMDIYQTKYDTANNTILMGVKLNRMIDEWCAMMSIPILPDYVDWKSNLTYVQGHLEVLNKIDDGNRCLKVSIYDNVLCTYEEKNPQSEIFYNVLNETN